MTGAREHPTGTPATPDGPALHGPGLVPLAETRHRRADTAPPSRRIPSFYADPASWAFLDAVDELWATGAEKVPTDPGTVATVLVSTHSTTATMTAVARSVAGGRVSPLRFAGANAGGPISVVCMLHRFRGPSLMITTGAGHGCPLARVMARHWLRTGAARHVVLGVHHRDAGGVHEVRCALLGGEPR